MRRGLVVWKIWVKQWTYIIIAFHYQAMHVCSARCATQGHIKRVLQISREKLESAKRNRRVKLKKPTNLIGPLPRDRVEIKDADRRRISLKSEKFLPPPDILVRNTVYNRTARPRSKNHCSREATVPLNRKQLLQFLEAEPETLLPSSDPRSQEITPEIRCHLSKSHPKLRKRLEKEATKRKWQTSIMEMRCVGHTIPWPHSLRSFSSFGCFNINGVVDSPEIVKGLDMFRLDNRREMRTKFFVCHRFKTKK